MSSVGPPNPRAALILFVAVTGDGHVGVARDADQHRLATAGVQQHEGVRVRGPRVAPDVQEVLLRPGKALPGVRAGDEPVLARGLARIGRKRDRPVQLGVQVEVRGDHGEDQNHHDRASDQGDSPSVVARLAPEPPSAAGSQSRLLSPARCGPAWCWPGAGRPGAGRPAAWCTGGCSGHPGRPLPAAVGGTWPDPRCRGSSLYQPSGQSFMVRHPHVPLPRAVAITLGQISDHSGPDAHIRH